MTKQKKKKIERENSWGNDKAKKRRVEYTFGTHTNNTRELNDDDDPRRWPASQSPRVFRETIKKRRAYALAPRHLSPLLCMGPRKRLGRRGRAHVARRRGVWMYDISSFHSEFPQEHSDWFVQKSARSGQRAGWKRWSNYAASCPAGSHEFDRFAPSQLSRLPRVREVNSSDRHMVLEFINFDRDVNFFFWSEDVKLAYTSFFFFFWNEHLVQFGQRICCDTRKVFKNQKGQSGMRTTVPPGGLADCVQHVCVRVRVLVLFKVQSSAFHLACSGCV
jgi:hypothetical protein